MKKKRMSQIDMTLRQRAVCQLYMTGRYTLDKLINERPYLTEKEIKEIKEYFQKG